MNIEDADQMAFGHGAMKLNALVCIEQTLIIALLILFAHFYLI